MTRTGSQRPVEPIPCRDCQAPTTYGMPDYLDTDGNVVCPDCARKDPDIYTNDTDNHWLVATPKEG